MDGSLRDVPHQKGKIISWAGHHFVCDAMGEVQCDGGCFRVVILGKGMAGMNAYRDSFMGGFHYKQWS